MTDLETILSIGEPALLEQLAEECSELAQAALKLARQERGENPTPKIFTETHIGCLKDLIEGMSDVEMCISVIDTSRALDIRFFSAEKEKRWAQNIRETKPIERSYRKRPVIVKAVQTLKGIDIETPEGVMHASPGDWIITGVNGEKYPCKPDIFAKTYEPVEEKQNE